MPDLTFMLDLPAEEGLARAGKRRGGDAVDRFEAENIDFHRALRAAFRSIAERNPQRCVIIDAGRTADEIAADIWREVETRLLDQKAPA
jgi:dTMP kinase